MPGTDSRYGLTGRVVTMDGSHRVLPRATVYVDPPNIAAVVEEGGAAPKGFESAPVVDTRGTIYPGLIELHNHLSYNALRLWEVPRKYGDRGEWQAAPEYVQMVTGPMGVLGRSKDPKILPALVRFVEAKCLVAGVTTSQGIALASNSGIRRYYKGVVRNVEQPDDPSLPRANTRIPDLAARDWQHFDDALKKSSCFLIHLSEGLDDDARKHFLALQQGNTWAITSALAGIHCAALIRADFEIMAERGASMVWSPLSNCLLYGETARVKEAKDAGVKIALGSDWSPSGSKNLLGELKVAQVINQELGGVFSDRELVAMVTRVPAEILKWDHHVGSIRADRRADLLVLSGTRGDAYGSLIDASEADIALVTVAGRARFGSKPLTSALGVTGEAVRIGGKERVADWGDGSADPDIETVTLKEARKILSDALERLPSLAADEAAGRGTLERLLAVSEEPEFRLALDEQEPDQLNLRPHLALDGVATGEVAAERAAAKKLPLVPLELDPLTVADDTAYNSKLQAQKNLPPYLKEGLGKYFQ